MVTSFHAVRATRAWLRSAAAAVTLCMLSLVVGGNSMAQARWPSPKLPDGLSTFDMGGRMQVNGLPIEVKGFVSAERPEQLVAAWRRSLGQPLMESTSGSKVILGRAEGGFYLTVQIQASGAGSKGTVSVSDLSTFSRSRQQQQQATARLLERLPSGSSLASQMSSQENGRSARHLVIVNGHDEERNRDAVLAMMTGEGYVLEREMTPDAAARRSLPAALGAGKTLYFTAAGKEAMAVVTRSGATTSIVLNTVVTLEGFK